MFLVLVFVVLYTIVLVFLVYILLNSNMIVNWKIRQELEGGIYFLIQLLHQNLPTGTRKIFDN